MLPANAKIVECPFCGTKKELLSLASGNTLRAKHWSDQKMIAPMLPRVSPVQKCPTCGKYYLEYKQPYKEGNGWSSERGELSYQEWKEAYHQFLSDKSTTKDDLQIIRRHLIQAFNDNYYRNGVDSIPAEEEAYFVSIIHEYIDSCSWNKENLLFKAELYREASEMENCAKVLSQISTSSMKEFELKIFNAIKTRMEKGDKAVFSINDL